MYLKAVTRVSQIMRFVGGKQQLSLYSYGRQFRQEHACLRQKHVDSASRLTSVNVARRSISLRTWPRVIKLFSCSTQMNMKFFWPINVKMPTIVGILTVMSGKNSILALSEPKKSRIS